MKIIYCNHCGKQLINYRYANVVNEDMQIHLCNDCLKKYNIWLTDGERKIKNIMNGIEEKDIIEEKDNNSDDSSIDTFKIFISTPMHGKSIDEIKQRIEEIINWTKTYVIEKDQFYKDKKIEFVSSVDNELTKEEFRNYKEGNKDKYYRYLRITYLSKAIAMLATCDYVVFDIDYKIANGCRIENMISKLYNIPAYYMMSSAFLDK